MKSGRNRKRKGGRTGGWERGVAAELVRGLEDPPWHKLEEQCAGPRWTSVMASDRGTAEDTNIISRRGLRPEETDMSEIHARYISRVQRGARGNWRRRCFLPTERFNFAQSTSAASTLPLSLSTNRTVRLR